MMTGPCQVRQIVRTGVLSCTNVFDLKGMKSVMLLAKTAVLASISCTLPDQLTPWKVNPQAEEFFKYKRALAWRMAIKFPMWT